MMPLFFILNGVRRAVSAREAGLKDVPGTIYVSGKPPVTTRLGLDQLLTSKPVIARDARYINNTETPTRAGRQPPPIEVEPFGAPGQPRGLIPLLNVKLI